MPRYEVRLLTYATQCFTQTVVVEAAGPKEAKKQAAELAHKNDDWEEEGGLGFDGYCEVDEVTQVADDVPLTQAPE
jgi:hypothetical protein